MVTDWFDIEGYTLGIRTTSHAFSAWIRHVLADYAIAPPPDKDDDDAIYSVVFEDGVHPSGRVGSKKFHILYYGTWDIVRTLDPRALAESLLHEIDSFTFPVRDDAVYVEASLLRIDGQTVLIPAVFVKPLADIGRRLQQHLDLELPGVMSVALDPETGDLVPPAPRLRFAPDWRERLAEIVGGNGSHDPRALVRERTRVDKIVGWMATADPMVRKGPRAPALFDYAKMVRNDHLVGAEALGALARVFERAEYRELQYFSWKHAVDALRALADGTDYSEDRSEATQGSA